MSNPGPWTEQTAEVVCVDAGRAWLRTGAAQQCGGCGARKACGSGALSNWLRTRNDAPWLSVDNHLRARPGEQVVIGVADADLLRAAVRAYLVPLLFMLLGALAAAAAGASDAMTVIAAVFGLGAGFVAGRLGCRPGSNEPHLLRVVSAEPVQSTKLQAQME